MQTEANDPAISARPFMGCMPSPISNKAATTVPMEMLPDESFKNRLFIIVLCKFVCVKIPKMRGMGVYLYERMWSISRCRQRRLHPGAAQAGMMQHGKARLL